MKLIHPSFEIWKPNEGKDGYLKDIERAGRVCYKSEDKITEDSAKSFVDRMTASGHGAMLEHGTVYLAIPITTRHSGQSEIRYMDNKYSVVRESTGFTMKDDLGDECNCWCITTNYRVLVENNWLDDLEYLCEPTEYHAKRACVHFVCDRGVSHEFVRHRVFSFAQESTRYCNYSKDKFGNELTFIIPCWADSLALQEARRSVITSDDFGSLISEYYYHLNSKESSYFKPWEITPERNFITSLQIAEQLYLELLNQGWKPQQARAVLPNSLKTELVMTGFIEDWKHFFELRCANNAHPQARELAIPLKEEFIKREFIKE